MTSAANAARPTSYREPGVTDEALWTDPEVPGLDALPALEDPGGASGLGAHGCHDQRNIADIHISSKNSPAAAGQRFLATRDLMWMPDIAHLLRTHLGPDGERVPTKTVPDAAVRLMAHRRPELRGVLPGLGRRNRHSTAKAQQLLGWRPRAGAEAVLDCARSLIDPGENDNAFDVVCVG